MPNASCCGSELAVTPPRETAAWLRREAARLHWRLLAAASTMTAACMIGLWLMTYAAVGDDVGRDLDRAVAIGTMVAPHVRGALDVQTPSERAAAVAEVLDAVLDTYAELAAVAIIEPNGRTTAYLGRAATEAERRQPEAVAEPPVRPALVHADALIPGGTASHSLRLWVERSRMTPFAASLWDLALALIVMILTLHILLRWLSEGSLRGPVALFNRLRSAIERHDWSVGAEPAGPPELRPALIRLNGAVRQINERRARLHWLAREIGEGDSGAPASGPEILGRYGAAAQHNPEHWTRESVTRDIAVAAALLFLGCFADQLVAWLAPSAAGLGSGSAGGPSALAAALPAIGYFTALGLGAAFGRGLEGRLSLREMFAAGCVFSAFGQMTFIATDALAVMTAGRALSGLGAAAMLFACFGGEASGQKDRQKLVGAVAVGIAGGTASGLLLTKMLDHDQVFAIAAIMSLAIVPLALRYLPPAPQTIRAASTASVVWRAGGALVVAAVVYTVGHVMFVQAGFGHAEFGRAAVAFGIAMLVGSTIMRSAAMGRLSPSKMLPAIALLCGLGILWFALPLAAGLVTGIAVCGILAGAMLTTPVPPGTRPNPAKATPP
jgi:MFS family permease